MASSKAKPAFRGLAVAVFAAALSAGQAPAHAQARQSAGYQPSPEVKAFLKKKWSPSGSLQQDATVTAMRQFTQAPPGFPVPVYPGTIKGGFERHSGLGKMTDLRIESKDPCETVTGWYAQALKSYGWSVNQKMPRGGGRSGQMSGYKDGKTCRISVARDSKGGSMIGISVVEHD